MPDLRETSIFEDKSRRWRTFTGPTECRTSPLFSTAAPASPDFDPLTASTSQDSRMSAITDNTTSSAASSALNTPEFARWTTLPSTRVGSPSVNIGDETQGSPNSYLHSARPFAPRYDAGAPLTKQGSSPLMRDGFASPYLDAPLLNIVPSLSPLKLPVSQFAQSGRRHDSPPAPPSPSSESCPTPASFSIPPPRKGLFPSALRSSSIPPTAGYPAGFFPTANVTPEPSPRPTIVSLSSSAYASDADSLVLPPLDCDETYATGSPRRSFVRASPSASQMDAFALAAAVAASPSRSSLSIPLSLQSESRRSIVQSTPPASVTFLTRPHPGRQQSCATQASTGHWTRSPGNFRDEVVAREEPDISEGLAANHIDRALLRRRSAPPPIIRHSPRPAAAKTITSRVDVGQHASARKLRSAKEPVLGKVRKIGERIRGLFKSKGDSPVKTRARGPSIIQPVPEYGLMTTTTAVTSVEYQSEHPIPAPSPRAKMLRNHRRSLPLPSLFIPSSADNLASAIFKRPSASRATSSHIPDHHASSDNFTSQDDEPGPILTQSPRTPRPQRQRTRTAPQTAHHQTPTQENQKSRRFSLSSALSKSRLDTIRSTMVPRPPLPSVSAGSTFAPSSTTGSRIATQTPSASGSDGGFWGDELPSVQITRHSPDRYSIDESPRRIRTQTAPPAATPGPSHDLEAVPTTPKAKPSRRFSLSSMMARQASRLSGRSPTSPGVPPVPVRRPRGDTITTITQGVPFDMVQPRQALEIETLSSASLTPSPNRFSTTSTATSEYAGSAYFDAREQLSEDNHHSSFDADRSCSPGPESDLDSMSFARTPDYSSGIFSLASGAEGGRYLDTDNLSIPGSYHFRSSLVGRCASTSAVSQLVGESARTPVVKTLRFSPSLSLSFERSWSDDGDGEDDEAGQVEREEERGFMRALGFEFDEIERRAREETL
ncbi:hypothetical protein C2E23DRAFT_736557 [Lenzites betulinus]|nr:hypothetical protein C2E23DRAFT_736557 [Lenzites betulinus]